MWYSTENRIKKMAATLTGWTMATGEQIKSLIRSHFGEDPERGAVFGRIQNAVAGNRVGKDDVANALGVVSVQHDAGGFANPQSRSSRFVVSERHIVVISSSPRPLKIAKRR